MVIGPYETRDCQICLCFASPCLLPSSYGPVRASHLPVGGHIGWMQFKGKSLYRRAR